MALRFEVVPRIDTIDPIAWDALAGGDHPFVEHAFLRALESSGSVGPGTGWLPRHLTVRDGERLVAAAPAYLKSHSYGEFIFDHAWAMGARRAGIPYYPKLTLAVPFTPAVGPRLLGHDPEARALLIDGASVAARSLGAHSVHCLFPTFAEADRMVEAGWQRRLGFQYHWHSPGWRDFQDYLDAMTSKRRKEVNRERRQAHEGLDIVLRHGPELGPKDWRAMYRFYRSTIDGHGSEAYLKEAFFTEIARTCASRVLMVQAWRDDQIVAATLNFHKGRHIYGRYWGADETRPALHFELCYYQLIEWGLQHGVTLIEAGAQGEHKLARGFLPRRTWSTHRIFHPGLSDAVKRFLVEEGAWMEEAIAERMPHGPFKVNPPEGSLPKG